MCSCGGPPKITVALAIVMNHLPAGVFQLPSCKRCATNWRTCLCTTERMVHVCSNGSCNRPYKPCRCLTMMLPTPSADYAQGKQAGCCRQPIMAPTNVHIGGQCSATASAKELHVAQFSHHSARSHLSTMHRGHCCRLGLRAWGTSRQVDARAVQAHKALRLIRTSCPASNNH